MHALNDVVKAGYARYIGMSSCYAWQCKLPYSSRMGYYIYPSQSTSCRASRPNPRQRYTHLIFTTDYAIANNLTPFISMQNHYSLLYREEEREMLPLLKVSRGRFQQWKYAQASCVLASWCWLYTLESPRQGYAHPPLEREHKTVRD